MAQFEVPKPGEICWRELATKDLAAAIEFYTKLFGWKLEQSKVTQMDYKEIQMDGVSVGGMMAIDENWGPEPPPSHWNTYVAVANTDETLTKIEANGGSIKLPTFVAPGVG